jgi:hypothetical protein
MAIRSFSTVAVGMAIPEGSVSFPLPWNSTLILLLARPGPEPIEIVHPSTAQPGISRSITEPIPGRIYSTKEKYGSSVASPFDGISGVQV